MKKAFENEIESLEDELETLINKLKKAQDDYVTIQREKTTTTIRTINKTYQKKVDDLKDDYKKKIREVEIKGQEEIKKLEEERIKELTNKNKDQQKQDADKTITKIRTIIEDKVWKKEQQAKKDAMKKDLVNKMEQDI